MFSPYLNCVTKEPYHLQREHKQVTRGYKRETWVAWSGLHSIFTITFPSHLPMTSSTSSYCPIPSSFFLLILFHPQLLFSSSSFFSFSLYPLLLLLLPFLLLLILSFLLFHHQYHLPFYLCVRIITLSTNTCTCFYRGVNTILLSQTSVQPTQRAVLEEDATVFSLSMLKTEPV